MRIQRSTRGRQQGGVAIITALSLVVLVGFIGLALDLGHLYVTKTELQNAADACALAAARELTCDPSTGTCPASYLQAAESAGIAVAARNQTAFQSTDIVIDPADVRFSTVFAPNSNYLPRLAADPESRYVMCIARRVGILPWFMQVLGVGESDVSAYAVATLSHAQTNCAIPLGMCSQGAADDEPSFGLEVGRWYDGRFDSGGGSTGSFNWIDYTPPSGGASELADLLTGSGMCNLQVSAPVGQSGILGNAAAKAWNSRFGLYQGGGGNPSASSAPPDYSGYAYTTNNWSPGRDALDDFIARRGVFDNYGTTVNAGNALTGLSISNAYNPTTTPAEHQTHGADRRLVTVPIVNCGEWETAQTVPIRGWACVLMLHPIGSPSDVVYMEYRGLSSDPDSPCGTSGSVGGPDSAGPQVPALVQ